MTVKKQIFKILSCVSILSVRLIPRAKYVILSYFVETLIDKAIIIIGYVTLSIDS